jgi:ABC-type lipoprotein release transport system permease subunit
MFPELSCIGVQSRDPVALLLAPLFLSLISVIAAWVPARRAAQVASVEGLRLN